MKIRSVAANLLCEYGQTEIAELISLFSILLKPLGNTVHSDNRPKRTNTHTHTHTHTHTIGRPNLEMQGNVTAGAAFGDRWTLSG